jgi:hypothetical protein
MQVNINEVATPSVKSFTVFAEPNLDLLRQTKTVRCSIHKPTKTRVSTDMQFGDYCVKINSPLEGYKQHADTQWNYFSGVQSTSYYFVKSKAQDFEIYKKYLATQVKIAMMKLGVELDEITIELEGRNF